MGADQSQPGPPPRNVQLANEIADHMEKLTEEQRSDALEEINAALEEVNDPTLDNPSELRFWDIISLIIMKNILRRYPIQRQSQPEPPPQNVQLANKIADHREKLTEEQWSDALEEINAALEEVNAPTLDDNGSELRFWDINSLIIMRNILRRYPIQRQPPRNIINVVGAVNRGYLDIDPNELGPDPISQEDFQEDDEIVVLERTQYGLKHIYLPEPLQQWFDGSGTLKAPMTGHILHQRDIQKYTLRFTKPRRSRRELFTSGSSVNGLVSLLVLGGIYLALKKSR